MNKYDRTHNARLNAIQKRVDKIFEAAAKEAAELGLSIDDIDPEKLFSFDDYPSAKRKADKLLKQLRQDLQAVIVNGITAEWALSNEKNDALVEQCYGEAVEKMSDDTRERFFNGNTQARDAFIERKTAGLNLSERVWNYSDAFKEELEMALDIGIGDGLSADDLSRRVRQYLKRPDMLFRRVRDKHGQLQLSKRAAAYHPGRGVYRSSYKNARRLAATESNIAYRTADHTRWQQLDFVVGVRVVMSNNHTLNGQPFHDICDDLSAPQGSEANKGRGCYPKDFKFTGWHPLCRCHAESILKTDDEFAADQQRIINGGEPTAESVNTVQGVPQEFTGWMEANKERIAKSKSLPYFIRDNGKYFGG